MASKGLRWVWLFIFSNIGYGLEVRGLGLLPIAYSLLPDALPLISIPSLPHSSSARRGRGMHPPGWLQPHGRPLSSALHLSLFPDMFAYKHLYSKDTEQHEQPRVQSMPFLFKTKHLQQIQRHTILKIFSITQAHPRRLWEI